MQADSKGARRYALGFYDTQGEVFELSVTLARPSNSTDHVLRLFQEKFTRLDGRSRRHWPLTRRRFMRCASSGSWRTNRVLAAATPMASSSRSGWEAFSIG